MHAALAAAAELLRTARRVVALSGAGVSAESGIPTFRDAQTGLWARYRAEELATPEAFARDPALVWSWYAWRRALVARAEPNPAHHAMAALQRQLPHFTLVTQNVDGLHRRAGSTDVLELHGDITRVRCSAEGRIIRDYEEPAEGQGPPPCPTCGAPLRPDVVWFGEPLPLATLHRASAEAGRCQVLLSVGTSALVYPAAGLIPLAERAGATVVVVNPDPAAAPPGALYLAGAAGELLPRLVAAAWPEAAG